MVTLAFGFNKLRETLGADDPFVQTVLGREARRTWRARW